MKTIELFAGTKSASKVFAANGHSTFTTDYDKRLGPDLVADVLTLPSDIAKGVDLLWASPPCETFSCASMGHHWGGGKRAYIPKTAAALVGMELVKKTMAIIDTSNPRWWFIENPRGVLRNLTFMEEYLIRTGGVRHTVWYCHYGENRAKPTDIWTNAHWWVPQPQCHNRRPDHPDTCCCHDHEAAPRGAKTGTQGIDGARDRGCIPAPLFEEILAQIP